MSKIKYWFIFLFIITALTTGCASVPPLPGDMEIVPPSNDIPLELAAFSGAWEGRLSSGDDIAVVIENINRQSADLIYSEGGKKPAYWRLSAKVHSGNVLEWTNTEEKSNACRIDKIKISRNKELDILILFMIVDCTSHQLSLRADLARMYLDENNALAKAKYPPIAGVNIVSPSSEVPNNIAVFSGIWEGMIYGYERMLLIVERIDVRSADIIVSMRNSRTGDIGYQYMKAEVLPGPFLKVMGTDGSEINFSINEGSDSLNVKMKTTPPSVQLAGKLNRLKNLPTRAVSELQKIDSPLPDDLMIVPPAQDIPFEIAALSGRWEGKWGGFLDGALVVERINKEVSDIIISWGEADGVESGYIRAKVKVLPGPLLIYEDTTNKWSFKMNGDLKSVSGEILEKPVGSLLKVKMIKAEEK